MQTENEIKDLVDLFNQPPCPEPDINSLDFKVELRQIIQGDNSEHTSHPS